MLQDITCSPVPLALPAPPPAVPAVPAAQFACILVGDEVSERYQWPRNIDLKINNMPHRWATYSVVQLLPCCSCVHGCCYHSSPPVACHAAVELGWGLGQVPGAAVAAELA